MSEAVLVMLVVFVVLLAMNVPIAVAIAMATVVAMVGETGGDRAARMVAHRMSSGIESFTLLAIPLFILSGLVMGRGGLARRLMDLANALLSRLPGGLGHVMVLTSMMFGAISGSAVAAVSSIGGVMIPEMRRKGYDGNYSVALATCAGTLGLIIPPSNIMIVYAMAAGGLSIGALFMAGVVPGLVIALALMVAHAIRTARCGEGAPVPSTMGEVWAAWWRALPSLLMIVVVLGGILAGMFTATEAAAISVAYSLVLTVLIYREIDVRALWKLGIDCAVTTSVVLLMVGASMAMSWMLARDGAPQQVSQFLLGLCETKVALLLVINVLLLAVGVFMDITPAVLILTPVLLPVARDLGIDPVHFGVVMIANLCIGLCTPPVGTCLYVGCGIGNARIADVLRPMLPLYGAMIIGLLVITYVPELSLWLPRALGLIQ